MSGVYSLADLLLLLEKTPESWRPMVFTNGCFDLVHTGHVRYLQAARRLGAALVVGLNSDRSVAKIKPQPLGQPLRPIMPQEQRAEVLAALKPVDAVVIFDEPTAIELIQVLQPEIYVKGGDYQLNTLPEASVVQSYGGKIELIQVEVPSSTTAIINRIIQLQGS